MSFSRAKRRASCVRSKLGEMTHFAELSAVQVVFRSKLGEITHFAEPSTLRSFLIVDIHWQGGRKAAGAEVDENESDKERGKLCLTRY